MAVGKLQLSYVLGTYKVIMS